MGKQIEYYIEFETFISIAEKALDLGCKIIKNDTKNGKVIESDSVDIISSDCYFYHFYVPEAGTYRIKRINGKEYLDHGYSSSGITLIEAMPTILRVDEKRIQRGRLFCVSDYYDEEGKNVRRPDCVTKIYNALANYVKKKTPYVETGRTVLKDGREYIYKKYVCDKYLNLIQNEGYSFGV